jgi:antitoxin (DNA-binding transcriptional repressor) of toxin-antitoxin stability system
MKALTIDDFKTRFSELLEFVKKGETIKSLYGKSRKPVAMLVPLWEEKKRRTIGILAGRATFTIRGDGRTSEKEFLGS